MKVFIPTFGAALVAGIALSACGGTATAPSGAVVPALSSPSTMLAPAKHGPPVAKGCRAAQVGYVFGGRCGIGQITAKGGHVMIPAYKGYSVRGIFGKNDAASRTTFVVRDATGNGDVSGTVNGASFPAFTGTGTAFLYLAVTNTSSTAVVFQMTPGLVITNIAHGGFPGTSCAVYALEPAGWTALGVTGSPKNTGKKGQSRLMFPATTLSTAVPFVSGATYFGLACQ